MARRSQRPYNVEYYRLKRELELHRVRVRQSGMVDLLRDLRRVPCADCGGRFKPHQMDFDHRDPSTKSFDVMTGRAMLMSTKRVLAEVAKCDIVCVNCHRIRTRDAERGRARKAPSMAPSRVAKRATWNEQAALLNALRERPSSTAGGTSRLRYDFDHRDTSTRRISVTRLVGRATDQAILAEAAKCDIVCANCHRARTFERRADVTERE